MEKSQCVGELEIEKAKPAVGFLCGSIPVPTDKAFTHASFDSSALVPSAIPTAEGAPRYRVIPTQTNLKTLPLRPNIPDKVLPMVAASHTQTGGDQLSRVKDLEAPDYGTLQAWEVRASAVARASNNDPNGNDASRSGQGGTPMPFLGETKVAVAFSGVEEKGEIKSESTPMKVLPPWMIKEGMNLTTEQRRGIKHETDMAGTSASVDLKDEKKSVNQDDDAKNLQLIHDEYLKAYYAAVHQRQKEQEEAIKMEQDLLVNNHIQKFNLLQAIDVG